MSVGRVERDDAAAEIGGLKEDVSGLKRVKVNGFAVKFGVEGGRVDPGGRFSAARERDENCGDC